MCERAAVISELIASIYRECVEEFDLTDILNMPEYTYKDV